MVRTPGEVSPNVNAVIKDGLRDGIRHSAEILDAIRVLERLLDRHGVLIENGEAILGHTGPTIRRCV